MNQLSKICAADTLSSLPLLSFLGGCGGGSSSNEPEGIIIYPQQPSPDPVPMVMGEGAPHELAKTDSITLLTKTLELARIAKSVIENTVTSVADSSDYFESGTTLTLADNDSSGGLSSFDSIDVAFNDCYLASIDRHISGTLQIDVSAISDDTQSFTATVVVPEPMLDFQGQFTLNYSHSLEQAQTDIILQPAITLKKDSHIDLTANGEIHRSEDYRTARYHIDMIATLTVVNFANDFTIAVSQPVWGFLDEMPSQGELTITGGNNNQASLIIAGVSDENWASWVDLTRLFTWGYNNEARMEYGPNVNQTIYRTVSTLTPLNIDSFPINDGGLRQAQTSISSGLDSPIYSNFYRCF